jgi:hypothetical protein
MEKSNNRIVHIDARIELKDYFHAYFDTVKTKLLVACLIVAMVIVAFSYFFILIGEQAILWQLSPLLFGLPIVAIAGQFLRIHASYRKYLGDLSESEKDIHYKFHENGDGFDIVRGKNFAHVAWESVRRVVERPRYFRFVLGKPESLIIPKRFLRHGSDEKVMREIMVSHIGNRAKLLRG